MVYLAWLGIRMLRYKAQPSNEVPGSPRIPTRTYRAAVRRGLLVNITNPKALIFCSVLLPQFVHADGGSATGQFFLLGVVLVTVGLLFDVMYVFAGALLGRCVNHNPWVQRA